MNEGKKIIIIGYCTKCKEELKCLDNFNFLNPVTQRYCDNNKCSRYGVVTVVSITKEIKT